MPRAEHEWATMKEVRRVLGIQDSTVRRLVDQGQLAGSLIDGRLRIRREDLAAFLEQARVKPGDLAGSYPSGKRERKTVEVDEARLVRIVPRHRDTG